MAQKNRIASYCRKGLEQEAETTAQTKI